jgi:hypothetical protein
MAKHHLDASQVGARFEKVGGKAVPAMPHAA